MDETLYYCIPNIELMKSDDIFYHYEILDLKYYKLLAF